jgi:predicted transposase YdaD
MSVNRLSQFCVEGRKEGRREGRKEGGKEGRMDGWMDTLKDGLPFVTISLNYVSE